MTELMTRSLAPLTGVGRHGLRDDGTHRWNRGTNVWDALYEGLLPPLCGWAEGGWDDGISYPAQWDNPDRGIFP